MLNFVGVGPGDPELLTLKALSLIRAADVVAVADSGGESAVLRIVGAHIPGKRIVRLDMPMRGVKADWASAHEIAEQTLLELLEEGLEVVYPVLGDPSLYASSAYLYERISGKFPCTIVPGVPAICAAAAALRMPLAKGREPLTVLPGYKAGEALPRGNVVVMKAGGALSALQTACAGRTALVARNLGMKDAYTGSLSDADLENDAYFTTVIIAAEREEA